MSELSKFINLLIEFEEKLEVNLNKKYKSFLRSILNLETLAKNIKPDRLILTRQLIVFKLGLEAKSPKAVEISLSYLLRCFQHKFIDVNQPNMCENYVIEESGVKEQAVGEVKTEVRHLLIDLIKKNLIYKNSEINQLILKVLEFLISEPVLPILLELSVQFAHQSVTPVLYNYFSFRFYVYQEICYYSQKEIKSFETVIKNERTQKEIQLALEENGLLQDLISKYMNEYISIIEKDGGRYGNCVMCAQPADHYCKITKASLCGLDCKKKHIEIAEHQYKHHFQSVNLWQSIKTSFVEMLVFLEKHESPLVFGVLAKLLDKPHLFMLTKQNFKSILTKHAPILLNRVLSYKNEESFESIYLFAFSLAKNWLFECLSCVQYFFREYVLKVFEEKKPSIKFLNLICRSLAKLFDNGKVAIQMYINFDCEVNRENIMEKILFEMARILQDRFSHANHISKQDRLSLKSRYLNSLLLIIMGLNQYRKQEPGTIKTSEIVSLKQKKMSLQQFIIRFNEHWTTGLKTLFNLNLVGLDSNEEIVDILMNLKGLSKENIDQLFFCEKGAELFEIFFAKLYAKHADNVLIALLELHHCIPLKMSSIGVKKYIQKMVAATKSREVEVQANRWIQFLVKNYSKEDFSKELVNKGMNLPAPELERMFVYAIETKLPQTCGNNKAYFTYCCSRSYLEVISNQIALLQIPLSYLLETDFEVDKIISLTEELVQICAHSNWISLLIKNSSIAKYPLPEFDEIKLSMVKGVLKIVKEHAYYIQDWSTIVNFLAFLYNTLQRVKAHNDSKVILEAEITISDIEECLLQASHKSEPHFNKLLLAMLIVGKEELEKDKLFMIQKFFEAIERNTKTFIKIGEQFMPYLTNFVKNLKDVSVEGVISIADMLKQTFAKLLKAPKASQSWADNCEPEFWKLYESLCSSKSGEVNDFVVNCVSMSVLNHFNLSSKSWTVLFDFMRRRAVDYRPQFYTILQKIVNCQLKGCESFGSDLISICLDLLHPTQTKITIEVLHLIRRALEIVCELSSAGPDNEQGRCAFKNLLRQVLQALIQSLFFESHEYIIELLFRLLKFKSQNEAVLSLQQIQQTMEMLFSKIEQYDRKSLQIAEKTLSFGLNWSMGAKYDQIILHLQQLVVDKYHHLSFSAVRCLKTYIQMINPKTQAAWSQIEATLIAILQNTYLSELVDLRLPNLYEDWNHPILPQDELIRTSIVIFSNKIAIQKAVIDILPNHQTCLEVLVRMYQEAVRFNDNLYLRVLLWRKGLGSRNREEPPNLLSLEEALASKIIITYQHTNQLFEFSYSIFQRYCQKSALLLAALDPPQPNELENWILYTEYLKCRRVPLIRTMNYLLPKVKRFCRSEEEKKKMVVILVESCKVLEDRQGLLKAIKELTKRQA